MVGFSSFEKLKLIGNDGELPPGEMIINPLGLVISFPFSFGFLIVEASGLSLIIGHAKVGINFYHFSRRKVPVFICL